MLVKLNACSSTDSCPHLPATSITTLKGSVLEYVENYKYLCAAKNNIVKLTILPILDFDDVIYKIASNTLLSKPDVVYHSAIRFVTKAPYITQHRDLYALVG